MATTPLQSDATAADTASSTTAADIVIRIDGNPTPAQRQAIHEAVAQSWPKQLGLNTAPAVTTRWRYSGRWWAQGRIDTQVY